MIHSIQVIGVLLLILGVFFVVTPMLREHLLAIDTLPWILVYIYRHNGLTIVTSPLLLLVSLASLLWWIYTHSGP
jgi:hypothetical protein